MSVNKVILIGNVGKEPDVKALDSGKKVANFPLATSERGYTLANGTQVPERTEWHNIVVWGGLAEVVERYVNKGDKLYLEGKIRTRNYDDKQGIKRYMTEVYVDNLEMLGSNQNTNVHWESDKQRRRAIQFTDRDQNDIPFKYTLLMFSEEESRDVCSLIKAINSMIDRSSK